MDYASLHGGCRFACFSSDTCNAVLVQGYIYMSVFNSQYPGSLYHKRVMDGKQDIKLLWPNCSCCLWRLIVRYKGEINISTHLVCTAAVLGVHC